MEQTPTQNRISISNAEVEIPVVLTRGAILPTYASEGASGLDLRTPETVELLPFERKLVWTGIHMAIPNGYEAQTRPRSGLALKKGVSIINTPGTIDSDYRGEIGVILINLSPNIVLLESGERIAQLVICPVEKATLIQTESLESTSRGEGGFGSTGRI
jgi:dUTP pyrophosphatase